ncbi:MAG: DinB family protein [Anaerolineales bacterium]|nr:DinB family protein [Anaerolineales bacterium]MCB8952603.1 DinB family protein [Ardenticatenales bacterium]
MTPPTADGKRLALAQELEATRAAFHQLLASMPADRFPAPTPNPAWNVGQMLFHMSVALRFLPTDAALIRRSGKLPQHVPAFLFHWLNKQYTRWGGRRPTHAYLAAAYDKAHAHTLAALHSVEENEWEKGVDYPGWDPMLSGFVTLEALFHYPARHFQAHAAELRQAKE